MLLIPSTRSAFFLTEEACCCAVIESRYAAAIAATADATGPPAPSSASPLTALAPPGQRESGGIAESLVGGLGAAAAALALASAGVIWWCRARMEGRAARQEAIVRSGTSGKEASNEAKSPDVTSSSTTSSV